MTENQKTKFVPPNNSAGRVIRIVTAMDHHMDNNGNVQWMPLYANLLHSESPMIIIPQLPMLIRSVRNTREFISSGHVNGLFDKHDYIGILLSAMESSAQNLTSIFSYHKIRGDLLELILRTCASNMPTEPALTEDMVKIIAGMEASKTEIKAAGLDAEVKDFCLSSIDAMIRALSGHEVLGKEIVRSAVVGIVDKADHLTPHEKKRIPESFRMAIRVFWGIAEKTGMLLQIGSSVSGLLK